MTDDIIDHLSFAVCNEGARPAGLIVNAIEEIERLRAERDRWRTAATLLYTSIHDSPTFTQKVAMNVYKKAASGE